MTVHDLNCLIARYSVDPDNEPAMALAAWYARVRDAMLTEQPAAESESAA